jgi:hypothetical protein
MEAIPRDLKGTALVQLLEMTESLQYRLSTHVSLTPSISQSIHSQQELISQLNQVFTHQHSINQLNQYLHKTHFMTTVGNFARSFKLDSIIKRGEQEIFTLTKTINTLRVEIESLNSDIGSQRVEAQRLNQSLQQTQSVLKRAIVEYRRELDEQKLVMQEQAEQLQRLIRVKVKNDFLVDMGYCILISLGLLSLFLVRKLVSRAVLRVFTSYASKKYRKRMNFVLELISSILIFMRLQSVVKIIGIHAGL